MKYFKKLLGALFALALLSTLFVVWFQRQNITDWLTLRNYQPSAAVVELADNTTMQGLGRRLFYINRPNIATKAEFNEACSKESSIVLGCYISGKGIYIYNVTDERLDGVKEVTAAHEMLHAAYERLSSSERDRIDVLTKAAYAKVTNERILQNVESYRKQDPAIVPNELHSILATEVKDLPNELETYYKQYFANRKSIVSYSDGYEKEFEKRNSQSIKIKTQLDRIKRDIQAKETSLRTEYQTIINLSSELSNLRNSGQFTEYNSRVPIYNQKVSEYNAQVRVVQADVDLYNSLVSKLESLQIEIKDLYQKLDSRPQTL